MILYGIKNCDTVKKARAWLGGWIAEFGWERVLNRAGTTFRKLPEADKEALDANRAAALMVAQPSMIKRPILEAGGRRLLGFNEAEWAEALA